MGKGAADAPYSIDNPESVRDSEGVGNQDRMQVKKDVPNQIQESNTQMSFKVKLFRVGFLWFPTSFMFAHHGMKFSIVDIKNSIHSQGPTNERQRAVVEALKHSWTGYKTFAWGHDNLKPIAQSYSDWFGLGLTIVDAIDTLYIADMQEEYDEARRWIESSLKFDVNKDVNLFETTIRVLGGLLSIYHLSGEDIYLTKAVEIGNRMLPCFDSPSSIPYSDVNLQNMKAHAPKWSPDSSTSEVTTIQLEFRDLSRVTNDPAYEAAVAKVSEKVHELPKTDGLVPIFINGKRFDSVLELIRGFLRTSSSL